MKNRFKQGILPGISQDDWYSLSLEAVENKYLKGKWEYISDLEKINVEINAVKTYLAKKNQNYITELRRISSYIPKMKAQNAISIVIPSHNENITLKNTLQIIISNITACKTVCDKVELLIVINDSISNTQQILDQEKIVNTFQKRYPNVHLYYVILQEEKHLCCVGLARMVGHDLIALRSNERKINERVCPLYMQLFDADIEGMAKNFFVTILNQIKIDNYGIDYYREYAMYPQKDIAIFNGLHAMDIFWNETITELSKTTNCGWTLGASTLISLFHYVVIGGIFPFNKSGGSQEDIRIGLSLNEYSKVSASRRNILMDRPLLYTNSRRALVGIFEVEDYIKNKFSEENFIPYELHLAARLLKYYINFNSQDLELPYEKLLRNSELSLTYVNIICNSYRELARDTLIQYHARELSEITKKINNDYKKGIICYSEMINKIKEYMKNNPNSKTVKIIKQAEIQSSEIIEKILYKYKFVFSNRIIKRVDDSIPIYFRVESMQEYKKNYINKLSFIIPTYNRKNQLIDAVCSILKQNPKYPFEVIICDNGSMDGTAQILDSFKNQNVRYIREEKKGPSCARNAGVSIAEGNWLIFLDDDVTLDENWIDRFYQIIEENDVNMICGKINPVWPENSKIPGWIKGDILNRLAIYNLGNEKKQLKNIYDIPYAANFAINKRVFEEIGGFSEKLLVSEDTDFLLKYLSKEYEYLYDPKLCAKHWIPQKRLSKKYFYKWSKIQGKYNCQVYKIDSLIPVYKHRYKKTYIILLSSLKYMILSFLSMKSYQRVNYRCIAISDFYAFRYCLTQKKIILNKKENRNGH